MGNTAGKKPLGVLDNVTFLTAINTILEEYKYHSSVLTIRKHSEQGKCFSFSEMSVTDILKLIKRISINKAMGEDQIPLKLIKTAGNFIVKPHTYIINSCFSTTRFPDLAKRASVTPMDKGGTDKHTYPNYTPFSALNTFSKIIESSILDQLTKHGNKFLQTFVESTVNIF